jgi:hypothetical protein
MPLDDNPAGPSEKQTDTQKSPAPERRRFWMDILTVVAMPIVTAAVGFTINSSLNARQERENNLRLYADVMTRREQADSDLRKDMFKSILDKFTTAQPDPRSADYLEQQVVNIELLAANFNESMDLGPLFKHVRRQIPDVTAGLSEDRKKMFEGLRRRLETIAIEINERQLRVLGDSGTVVRAAADDLEHANQQPAYVRFFGPATVVRKDAKPDDSITEVCLSMDSSQGVHHYRRFKLEVIGADSEMHELQVRLYVSKVLDQNTCRAQDLDLKGVAEIDSKFWVGLFDFPMVDNTRLTQGERCGVSMTDLGSGHAELTLSYFLGSRASLKDKPYFDELEHDLRVGPGARD